MIPQDGVVKALVSLTSDPDKNPMNFIKRSFDLMSAALGLIALSPVFVLVATLIKWEDGGPVFFSQERIGFLGEPFRMLKFRTMRVKQSPDAKLLTIGNDPRITKIGHYLRRYKLDEFPQLINVVRGEMSLVGPRPEVACYVKKYNEAQKEVLRLLPGITDPASIKFHNESLLLAQSADPEAVYVNEIMPEKIRLNLAYAATASLRTDIKIILRTLKVIPTASI